MQKKGGQFFWMFIYALLLCKAVQNAKTILVLRLYRAGATVLFQDSYFFFQKYTQKYKKGEKKATKIMTSE